MKIAIFGSGEVALKAAASVKKSDATIEIITDKALDCDYTVLPSYRMRGKYDVVVLTEDADNKALGWQLGQFICADGYALTLQPSADDATLSSVLGADKVVCGAVADGRILLSDSAKAKNACELLGAEISSHLKDMRFAKMADASFGAASAIAGCDTALVIASEAWLEVMVKTVLEFSCVANENEVYDITVGGQKIADLLTMKGIFKKKYPVKKIAAAVGSHADKLPVSEFEAITSLAKAAEIPAPYCEKTLAILKKIASGELARGPQNIKYYE